MALKQALCLWLFSVVTCAILAITIQQISAEDDVPLTKFNQHVGAPTLKFLYW